LLELNDYNDGASTELAEQADQRGALAITERLEDDVLHVGQHSVELLQRREAARGDRDHVPTPVVGVRRSTHETTGHEIVDSGHDVTAINPGSSAKVSLAGVSELVERSEQPEVVPAEALATKGVLQDLLGASVRTAEQPGRLSADTSQCGHRREPRGLLVRPTSGIVGATNDLLEVQMTTPFGPQLIGETEKTLNAILRRLLQGTGLSEPQWVTLRLAGQLGNVDRQAFEIALT
jgi:hypothetical protein